jgi:EAL and modified HD-GYP domain-containing signal transduction protein
MNGPHRERFTRSAGTALGAAIAKRSAPSAWPTYVARQPVYDRDRNVVAYELLFRDAEDATTASVVDAQAATGEAALTAMADIGLDALVGGRRALVNVSRSFLLGEQVLALPPGRVGLEVLESVEPDAEVMARLRELAGRGYQIMLDDFVLTRATMPLLDVARFVKLDVREGGELALGKVRSQLAGSDVLLVAEKIEHPDEVAACRDIGFHYFQGFVFGVPQLLTGRRIRPGRLTVLNLMNALSRKDASIAQLESIIVQDVGLSVTLLRYMNSAAVGLNRRVSSIREAIVYLGMETIRSFAYLVSLTAHSQEPAELARIGMIRGRMMEMLATALGHDDPPAHFTVGLLSVADSLLSTPMDVLLDELDELDDSVKRALIAREGELGSRLRLVESYELGRLDHLEVAGVNPFLVRDAYLRAVEWADETAACLIPLDARAGSGRDPLRRAS